MANTTGEKELKRDWPIITGLGADDKHEGRQMHLEPELNLVSENDEVGL